VRASLGALVLIGAYDELWSGIAVVAAPGVEQSNALDHGAYALWIFALPMLLASLLETPVTLFADRLPLRRMIAASLTLLALSLAACALAPSAWVLSLALAVAGATSGVACTAAQVALVSADPSQAARALSRWTAGQAAGDSLAPLFVSGALWLGGDHSSALGAIAVLVALQAAAALRSTPPASTASEDDETPDIGLRAALRLAAGNRRLWFYLAAGSICGLLDEVVVALAALRLHDDLGWSPALAAAAMTGISVGGIAGALLTDRLLARISTRTLLVASGAISLIALAAFIATASAWVIAVALFVLGAASAAHHPLTMAEAHRVFPGRPGIVVALSNAFVLLDVLLPLAIGLVASRFGLAAALGLLALQPLVMLAVGLDRSGLRSAQKVL
jgi:predicted MFS family arabinose efflux permease